MLVVARHWSLVAGYLMLGIEKIQIKMGGVRLYPEIFNFETYRSPDLGFKNQKPGFRSQGPVTMGCSGRNIERLRSIRVLRDGKDLKARIGFHTVFINVKTTQFLFPAHSQPHKLLDDIEEEES